MKRLLKRNSRNPKMSQSEVFPFLIAPSNNPSISSGSVEFYEEDGDTFQTQDTDAAGSSHPSNHNGTRPSSSFAPPGLGPKSSVNLSITNVNLFGNSDYHGTGVEGEHSKVSRMIISLTESASEDWPLTLDICKRASAGFAAARDASRTLKLVLQYGGPGTQLSATRLLDTMLRICSNAFTTEASRSEFLFVLEEVLQSRDTSPIVREQLLDVLAGAAFMNMDHSNGGYRTLWKRFKPPDKPEEGIPFNHKDVLLNWHANPTQEHFASANEDMWRWLLRECEISKGNARLLNEALAFAKPEDLNSPVITEWYQKCHLSQDFIVAQLPWTTIHWKVDSSGANSEKIAGQQFPAWKELFLDAFLDANGALLEAMTSHDDLKRLGQPEGKVEQRNLVGTDSSRAVESHGRDPVQGGDVPSPSSLLVGGFSKMRLSPPSRPVPPRPTPSIPIHASESDTYIRPSYSDEASRTLQQQKQPGQSTSVSEMTSYKQSTSVAPLVSQNSFSKPLCFYHKNREMSIRESGQDVVNKVCNRNGASSPVAIQDAIVDKELEKLYDEVFESFTSREEDRDSVSSELSGGGGVTMTETDILGTGDFNASHPEVHLKDHFPALQTQKIVKNVPSLTPRPSLKSHPDAFTDLPGKTVHFSNTEMVSTRTSTKNPKFNIENIPNLTGRIKIIKGPLLAGGFCDIFSGELTTESGTQPVAMKMLRVFNTEAHVVKAKKKFRGEVNLWCSLRHDHVLPFYGTCELDEFRLFMVSPWAKEGNSLEYLRRNPFADRTQLLWQTASALEYLHSGRDAPQVVHGDLKADNVLISASGDALLCDFGLSRHVEEIISKSGSSSAGRAGGHARFMAPELLLPPKGTHTSGPTRESDVFAFASLMLQIYTEELPFGELFEAQAILKIASGQIPSRPRKPIFLKRGVNAHIWNLMRDCWQFEPSERPTMEQVGEQLRAPGSL